MIRIENLTKIYRRHVWPFRRDKVQVLSQINLVVEKGSLLVITGPNGSGKTTLLKIIAGLVRPSAGKVWVDGVASDRPERIRTRVGMVTGDGRSFYARLSALENLRVFAAVQGIYGKRFRARVTELTEQLDLSGSLHVRFQELSQGTRARLAFVRSLIHDPPVLLFDEPFQSIDVGMMNQLKDWIFHDLVQVQRKTLVFVSHRSEEFEGWDCRLVSMSNGRMIEDRQIETCQKSLWNAEALISGEKS